MPETDQDAARILGGGRYRLEEELGAGATATVWRATDTTLGVSRAIKLLHRRAAGNASLRRRLLAEARAMARLEHPHVLRVLDIATEGGRAYVVMPLASHGSVADYLDADGPLPP
ncbi:MAG: serine/threonine protein kinase, partial [Deltaproteobacteria bacterium]